MAKDLIIQVNIPLCVRRCAHCGQTICKYDPDLAKIYARSLLREIEVVAPEMADYAVRAVALEGGSPALLAAADLQDIIRALKKQFHLTSDVQISLQTMPGDYSRALMEKMRDSGVNFWTIGLATADRSEHEQLRRPYRYDALTMVDMAVKTFEPRALSFDLIYGIPGQTLRSWDHTLSSALAYGPDHLCLHAIDLTGNCALRQDVTLGLLEAPTPDHIRNLRDAAADQLIAMGYTEYLPDSFCLPGRENRFLRLQSQGCEQLGLGYQATSRMDGYIYTNGHSLREYMTHPGDLAILANGVEALNQRQREQSH